MKKKEALAIHLVKVTRKHRGRHEGEAIGLFLGGLLLLAAIFWLTYIVLSLLSFALPLPHLLRLGLATLLLTGIGAMYLRHGRQTRVPGASLLVPAGSNAAVVVLFAGPRLIEESSVAWSLARNEQALDLKGCVTVLARMMSQDQPMPEPEVRGLLADRADADLVIRQLLTFEGVLLLHSKPPALMLTPAFRGELIEVCRQAKYLGGDDSSGDLGSDANKDG